MTTAIAYVQNKSRIRDAEFIRISVEGHADSPFLLSTSFKKEFIVSEGYSGTYTPLGGLVSISAHTRDLSATSFDTSISLFGVDRTKIGSIIDAGLKGAAVKIYRGFYDDNYQLQGTVLRYTGIVSGFDIAEDRQGDVDSFVLTIQAASFRRVLENRIAGRLTNPSSWRFYNPNDTSMDNVPSLRNAKFNFGQPV